MVGNDDYGSFIKKELEVAHVKTDFIETSYQDKTNINFNIYNNTNKTNNNVNSNVNKSDKSSLVGFILGLVSIAAWIIPLFGYPVTICGIIFSAKGLKSINGKGKAIAGLILSITFLIASFINSIIGVIISLEA